MKKYVMRWEVDDEDFTDEYEKNVDGVYDNIYAYPFMEDIGSPIEIFEVDTETGEEKKVKSMVLVNAEETQKQYGDSCDEKGFKKCVIYIASDIVISVAVNPEKIQMIDFDPFEYWNNYKVEHQKWLDENSDEKI